MTHQWVTAHVLKSTGLGKGKNSDSVESRSVNWIIRIRKQGGEKSNGNYYINDLLTYTEYFLYARNCITYFNVMTLLILRQIDI